MSPSTNSKRARYGTRQFIEQAFRGANAKAGLKTSELTARVQELAGKSIPGPTIFQAARSLVRAKVLETRRDGREFRFSLAGTTAPESSRSPDPVSTAAAVQSIVAPSEPNAAKADAPRIGMPAELALAETGGRSVALPHRLEPGQVLILKHDEDAIVTVSNVHGRPVVEKHRIT